MNLHHACCCWKQILADSSLNQQSNSRLLDTNRRTSWSLGSCSRIRILSSLSPLRVIMLKECIIHEMLYSFQTHLCSCQGSARLQIKTSKRSCDNFSAWSEPSILSTKIQDKLDSQNDRKLGSPADTSKSHTKISQLLKSRSWGSRSVSGG